MDVPRCRARVHATYAARPGAVCGTPAAPRIACAIDRRRSAAFAPSRGPGSCWTCVAMTTSAVVRSTTRGHRDSSLAMLVDLAADLTAQLASSDRSQRVVEVVQRAPPCDSAAL